MADKSPRSHESKTSGKTIKEKRAEKRAAAGTGAPMSVVPPAKSKQH